jgi:hypothetical protein
MDWTECLAKDASGNTIAGGIATIQCLPIIFKNIINAALIFAGATTLAFIVVAGFTLMNSGGDPKKLETAQKTLTFAIVGLVLILMSFFIVNFIAFATGVNCINLDAVGFNNCT